MIVVYSVVTSVIDSMLIQYIGNARTRDCLTRRLIFFNNT